MGGEGREWKINHAFNARNFTTNIDKWKLYEIEKKKCDQQQIQ
jgi:hypothetical protein